jgi:hypothetical protein
MATITMTFTFENMVNDEEQVEKHEFDLDSCVEDSIQEYQEAFMADNDMDGDWDCTKEEVLDIDVDGDESADETRFNGLDELGEYAEKVEEHGEAYALRYEDIGEFDFDDSYEGCWKDVSEYAQNYYESCYGSDNPLYHYVDWDSYGNDLTMDLSIYDGSDGMIHVFRDY